MNGQLNSLESFDSGSNYRFGDKMIHSNVARSLFDLSHLNTLTIPCAGMLVPITWFETLPGDDHDINVDCLLRVLPQVVPLYSRQRLYIYGFYSRYSDLWSNWQVFMDKGYTGTDNRTIPTLHKDTVNSDTNVYYDNQYGSSITTDSLLDYLGLPIGKSADNLFNKNNNNPTAKISALPIMMYLRIYRDYFMNKNHWINDRVMLPDDDSRFRLNDNGKLLSAIDQNANFYFGVTGYNGVNRNYDLTNSGPTYIFCGAMHDYPDDYFTSAIPFPQRGNPSKLDYKIDLSNISMDFSNTFGTHGLNYKLQNISLDSTANKIQTENNNDSSDSTTDFMNAFNKGKLSGSSIGLDITLNNIINLAIEQQMLIQLARTDGSYFQFGLSFFGEPSKAAYDYRPTYIGGTYKNIAFTEVLQTATTQTTQSGQTVDNPAGAYVGHGITGISKGRIGHIHCDDYGMIMLIACIMPDVYYSQGLNKTLTEQTQEEKFLPDRALLEMQPILNKEIYYAGNNGNSQGDDNYLWAYQNPFDHLRYQANQIHGKIADPNSLSFYPYTQARHFTQLPNWGRTFSSTNDVRKDYLTAPTEDAYTAQFSMNIRSVRPLPYKATPAKLVHM